MNRAIEAEIVSAEEQLKLAMLKSDVDTLDVLLAPDLMFTNHLGQVLSKQDDLAAHQSGALTIDVLEPSEQQIIWKESVAIVSVRVHLAGSYEGTPSDHDFRFTRVWSRSPNGHWQIIAGHSSIVM